MPDPFLIPSLRTLRSEFNAIAPGRDKASDGWIGDAAHSASQSDHNPAPDGGVHAIDVDRDLREPGLTMEVVVQFILMRCRMGIETRLKYIIFNRRIWSASSDWVQRTYAGANPHDKHAHFSGKYDSASENSTRSWGLEGEFMALTADDKAWLSAEIANRVRTELAKLVVPTPAENAEALWHRFRNDVRPPWSDTARNLLGAEITEAVVAGVPIERYPANEGK